MSFQRATKKQLKLRMALSGPSGAGKTYTGLALAFGLVGDVGKVAVLDTEYRSAEKHAGSFPPFDVDYLIGDCSPDKYTAKIVEAEAAGYECLVIDSLSHEWIGVGGALQMVDEKAKQSKSGNSYFAWGDVTPAHNRMIGTILACKMHVIVTMRTKTHYDVKEIRGKQVPVKIGLAPVQRDGMEYEFDVIGEMTDAHNLVIGKTRCVALDGAEFAKPDSKCALVTTLRAWLDEGEPMPAQAIPEQAQPAHVPAGKVYAPDAAKAAIMAEIKAYRESMGLAPEVLVEFATEAGGKHPINMTAIELAQLLGAFKQAYETEPIEPEAETPEPDEYEIESTPETAKQHAPRRGKGTNDDAAI